jgi:raffinose/stachyose/melibiose transport system permease protein
MAIAAASPISRARVRAGYRVTRGVWTSAKYLVLVVFAVLSLIPILWMWVAARRSRNEVLADPFALPKSLDFGNLAEAWTVGRFGAYFLNSVITTAPTVAGVVALSCLAGYGFARFTFRGKTFMFYAFLLGLMVPFQSIMIPLYYELRDLGMLGTYWAFILPAIGLGLPFGIFLMQAYFRGIPTDLGDAAKIDGCSEFQIFWHVMLPLAGPAVATLTVFQFVWTWNAFLMPLLYLQSESLRPIPLGMMFFQGRYTSDIGLLAAGVTIATVPVVIIYLIFQRQFIRGITAGAVK